MADQKNKTPFAKRSLGQNFLVDSAYIAKIINALDIGSEEIIIEIGPGRGALTERLVEKASRLIALELDRGLIPLLAQQFSNNQNFTVLEADALEIDFAKLVSSNPQSKIQNLKSKLVANLPYYISTAILQRLIEQRQVFSMMVLMFQKEVVDRITAPPGNSDRGFLTVLAEAFLNVEKLFDVPPTAFRPQPKVWSSVVRITPKTGRVSNESVFRELVSSAFLQKRKTIRNNLKNKYPNAAEILLSAAIGPKLRPEALTLEQWQRLAQLVKTELLG
jgi:16S rRNA (adenine1518-N6/adenine1519-N6)-dimethyltransferase